MLFRRPRNAEVAQRGDQAPILPLWRPEVQLGTPLSEASGSVITSLETMHDRQLFEARPIPEGHPLFPSGGHYRITNFYDRVQFGTKTGTGAWMVSYQPEGADESVRVGAFATTKVKHVYRYFAEPEDRDKVIATMVAGRGGNLVPYTRDDLADREAQVVAILQIYAEQLAEEARAAQVATGMGAAAIQQAA